MRLPWSRREAEPYVCEAKPQDLPVLAEIHEACFAHPWSESDLEAMLSSSGVEIWTARQGGENGILFAFAILRIASDEAEIIAIATKPSRRRRGGADALMRRISRRLREDRIPRLFLEVSERNSAALAFYRGLGFREAGRREAYYREEEDSSEKAAALVMALEFR